MKKIVLLVLSLTLALSATLLVACNEHQHKFSKDWSGDVANHWHACTDKNCSETSDLDAHEGGSATYTEKAICTVCGQEYGEVLGVAKVNGVGYETLQEAIQAAGNEGVITIIADGTYTLTSIGSPQVPTSRSLTFVGTKNTVIDMTSALSVSDCTITFDGVTLLYDNDAYEGLQHAAKEVYKNCAIKGTMFLYAPTVEFTNCTFDEYNATTEYSVWTYGATNVTFTDCEFTTNGKAILVYNETTNASFVANVTLTNCNFSSDKSVAEDKAVVETGSNASNTATSNRYNITFTNCTETGFVVNQKGIITNSTLWANKNSMDTDHLNVIIDGNDVY